MAVDDKSGSVWAVAIIFAILSWLTVSLRVYVRARQIGKFGIDDKVAIIAQIFFTAYLVCQMGGAAYGTGRRLANLDYAAAETALRFWFFCEVWYALATSTVKIAICLSLRRVTVNFKHLVIIWGLIIWSIALGLAFLLGVLFQCIPISDWWSLDPAFKRCLDRHIITSLTYTVSALNVACDFTLAIFPFFIVKDLAIPTSQKVIVASILAFGAFGSTATIIRMAYIPALEETYEGWNGDFLYDTTPVAIWSTVEVGVGITAICLSTLRPLLSKIIGSLKSSYYTSYATDRSGPIDSRGVISPLPFGYPTGDDDSAAEYYRAFFPPQHELQGMTHFNATKPLGNSHDDIHRFASQKRPEDDIKSATRFNTTKALDSSFDNLADTYHASSSSKRFRPP